MTKSPFLSNNEQYRVLDLLLRHCNQQKYITFANNDYLDQGKTSQDQITPDLLINNTINLLPRCYKSKTIQKQRRLEYGEVLTPLFVIEQQATAAMEYLYSLDSTAKLLTEPVLEITAGEGHYTITRYDPETGDYVPVAQRCGVIDQRLKHAVAIASDFNDFWRLALKVYKASYGYELQGDSLAILRINLLESFADYCNEYFSRNPTSFMVEKLATIIANNFMQVDGLTLLDPQSQPVSFLSHSDNRYYNLNDLCCRTGT